MLDTDVVEPSTSLYNSPLWIVPKRPDSQGSKHWRLACIDYRKLNDKTIGDAYPLPSITEILDQLGSAKYFSTFDLASGFHQIRMAQEDAHKTAFSTLSIQKNAFWIKKCSSGISTLDELSVIRIVRSRTIHLSR